MKSAVKAAIISVGLLALLVGGYFLFVSGPDEFAFQDDVGTFDEEPGGEEPRAEILIQSEDRPLVQPTERGSIQVSCRVVEQGSGRTLTRSTLQVLKAPQTESSGELLLDLPDGGGRGGDFAFSLPPGSYRVVARCRGYTSSTREFVLIKDQDPFSLTFELHRGNSISGHIFSPDGSPIPGAKVAAMRELVKPDADLERILREFVKLEERAHEIQEEQFVATSGPDGYYQIDGLDHDYYAVRAVADGFSPGQREQILAPREGVDIRLQEGGAYAGQVKDRSGRPIAGASIKAYKEFEQGEVGLFKIIFVKTHPPVDEAETDDSGRFELTRLGKGLYNFRVSAPGYQVHEETRVRVRPGENALKTFFLEAGNTIRGIVRGPDDQPVSGARVRATPRSGGRVGRDQVHISFDDGSVETDAQGLFVFDTLSDEPHMLMVFHDDYQSVQRRDVRPSREEVVVRLSHGGQMEGVVIDAATGLPIPGALVSVPDLADNRKQEYTDRNGNYLVSGLNTSRSKLQVQVSVEGYAAERRDVRPEANRVIREDFELQVNGAVQGRILLSSGDPLPGAWVEVRRVRETTGTPQTIGSATSNSDGFFVVENVEPGRDLEVRAKMQTYLDTFSEKFGLEPGDRVDVGELVMSLGGSVEGVVTNPEGAPIVGCMVEARPPGSTDVVKSGTVTVQTGSDGRYLVHGLQSGTVDLVFTATNFVEGILSGVQIKEAQKNTNQDIVLEPAGIIAGRVLSVDGRGVPGAEILVRDFSDGLREIRTVSNANGEFRLANIESKTSVALEVSHKEYSDFSDDDVKVGDMAIEVVLQPLGRITGRVVDIDGVGVSTFSVRPEPQSESHSRQKLSAKNFSDGRFEYGGLYAGTYNVYVRSPRHSVTTIEAVPIGEGETVDLGEIVLQEGGITSGRVVEAATGQPVSGARVRVVEGPRSFKNRSAAKTAVVTGADGAFSISDLKGGPVTLEVTHEDFVTNRVGGVDVQVASTSRDLLVELERGGQVSGVVVDGGGQPMTGMNVYLIPKGQRSGGRFVPADDGGVFTFPNIGSGTYTIKAQKFVAGSTPLLAEQEIVLRPGESLRGIRLVVE